MTTIETRLHGAIDYGAASLLAGLSLSRRLPPPVRFVLGTAAAYHTAYALVTDYEAGLRPALSMRQHLVLDVLGGAGLCFAGIRMRRQGLGSRALLVGAGLAELAVVARSSMNAASGPGGAQRASYPPIDLPKPVADDLFIVDSVLPGVMGAAFGVRMTVIRLPSGELLLHSPTRHSLALQVALEKLGAIRHIVAPSFAHWTFVEGWQRACPQATVWAAPGLRRRKQVRRSGIRIDRVLRKPPSEWGDAIELAIVPGGMGFREVALFHRPSRTLLLCDVVMNLEPAKVSPLLRPIARLFGMTAPEGMPPPYLRALIKLRKRAAKRAAQRMLSWRPVRVIFAHGRWFERDGSAALRRSLRWLIDPG